MARPQDRKTARPQWNRSQLCSLGTLFLIALTGCASVRETEPLQNKAEAANVEPPADSICGERPGRTAITVQWGGIAAPGALKQLSVVVTNTSATTRVVTLLLAGTSPNGQKVIEQKWSEFALAAGEVRTIQLPLNQAPIQSTVRPSGLSVVAQFTEPGAAAETQRVAFSEPLLLTFSSDFMDTTVRSLGEQKRADVAGARLDAMLPPTPEVRVRDEKTGAIVAVATQGETANDWGGAMLVRDVTPEEVEASRNHPSTPDSEVLPDDGGPGFAGETL